jgi:hypothetical protein
LGVLSGSLRTTGSGVNGLDRGRLVKTRHAVALVLVDWYLMVPPTEDGNHIDPFVPLPKWVVLRAFDTATACDEAQDQLRDRISHLNLQIPGAPVASEAAEFSQCIDSYDPRLKEKYAMTFRSEKLIL